jgi:N-acetylglucosamine kinase-like BadF-type ATPase
MSRRQLVLGVDGGGTKSIGLISDHLGNILARRVGEASNANVVGVDAAAQNLFQLITMCCEDIRCQPDELRSIVFGLAGAGREEIRRGIQDTLEGLFVNQGLKLRPISIETDARVALEGAFDGGPGVVIIAGTGSIVIGKTQRGDVITVGGWGRLLGDEGSGYYIGREALKEVMLQYECRGNSGKLREILVGKYNWSSREEIIGAVYQENFDVASIAPVVLEAAADHDVVSQNILQRAATQLVEQAQVVVMQLGIVRKVFVAMCGSLIDHDTVYANALHIKLLKMLPQVDIRPAVHSPAHGAVLMALEKLKKM